MLDDNPSRKAPSRRRRTKKNGPPGAVEMTSLGETVRPAASAADVSVENQASRKYLIHNEDSQELVRPKEKGSVSNRGSFSQFVKGQLASTKQFITSKDLYGQPVSLNYQGEDTYKTCPGGCLSITLLVTLFLYAVLKFKYMMLKEEWQLIQQTVVADLNDLERPFDLGSPANQNISMAIQFYLKKPKQTVADQLSALSDRQAQLALQAEQSSPSGGPIQSGPGGPSGSLGGPQSGPGGGSGKKRQLSESYTKTAKNIAKYLQVVSMIEKKSGSRYATYNNINPDLYTWVPQLSRDLNETNEDGERILIEMPFDLANATIQGTENHLENMDVVTSRYQIRFNRDLMQITAFKECMANPDCSSHFTTSKPQMLNNVFSTVFDNYENQTVSERVQSTKTFKFLQQLAVSEDEMDEFTFYKSYYSVFVPLLKTIVENKRDSKISNLFNAYQAEQKKLADEAYANSPAGKSETNDKKPEEETTSDTPSDTPSNSPSDTPSDTPSDSGSNTPSDTPSTPSDSGSGDSSGEGSTSDSSEGSSPIDTSGGDSSSPSDSSSGDSSPSDSSGSSGGSSPSDSSSSDSGGSTPGDSSPSSPDSSSSDGQGGSSGGGGPGGNRRMLRDQPRRKLEGSITDFENNKDTYKSFDYQATLEIENQSADLLVYKSQQEEFTKFLTDFESRLNRDLEAMHMQLVVYDEIEFFRQHDDDQFNYPYQKRKNKISQSTFSTSTEADGDYQYPVQSIFLQQSVSCLEASVFEQMNFVTELFSSLPDLFGSGQEVEEEKKSKTIDERCDSATGFEKIKYVDSKTSYKNYLDDYEKGVIPNKILLEVSLEMDAFMTMSLRTSTQILDFLGDIGGFYQALDLIIFMVAEYFSARFFLASIASTLYLLKDSKQTQEVKQKLPEKIQKLMKTGPSPSSKFAETAPAGETESYNLSKHIIKQATERFNEIRVSPVNLIIDPLIELLLSPCKRCCLQRSVYRRQKILDQCEDKFSEELEITNLLSKIRDTHDMTLHLKDEAMKEALKFTKTRIIELEEVATSSEDRSGDEANKEESCPQGHQSKFSFPDCVSRDIQNAIGYSVINETSLPTDVKEKLLESSIRLGTSAALSSMKDQESKSMASLHPLQEASVDSHQKQVPPPRDNPLPPSQFLKIEDEAEPSEVASTRRRRLSKKSTRKKSIEENPEADTGGQRDIPGRIKKSGRVNRSKSRKKGNTSSRKMIGVDEDILDDYTDRNETLRAKLQNSSELLHGLSSLNEGDPSRSEETAAQEMSATTDIASGKLDNEQAKLLRLDGGPDSSQKWLDPQEATDAEASSSVPTVLAAKPVQVKPNAPREEKLDEGSSEKLLRNLEPRGLDSERDE